MPNLFNIIFSTIMNSEGKTKQHKNTKLHRFAIAEEQQDKPVNRRAWPTDGVIYIGHLPHGFYQDELTKYFSQYGDVLGVKVARSKKTNRSKGYAFVQFKYAEVAEIVSQTMDNYLLLNKVLVCHRLSHTAKNPFHFSSSKKYKFVNWKRIYIKRKNAPKTDEQVKKQVSNLLEKQQQRRQRLKSVGINYEFPGFKALLQM